MDSDVSPFYANVDFTFCLSIQTGYEIPSGIQSGGVAAGTWDDDALAAGGTAG